MYALGLLTVCYSLIHRIGNDEKFYSKSPYSYFTKALIQLGEPRNYMLYRNGNFCKMT